MEENRLNEQQLADQLAKIQIAMSYAQEAYVDHRRSIGKEEGFYDYEEFRQSLKTPEQRLDYFTKTCNGFRHAWALNAKGAKAEIEESQRTIDNFNNYSFVDKLKNYISEKHSAMKNIESSNIEFTEANAKARYTNEEVFEEYKQNFEAIYPASETIKDLMGNVENPEYKFYSSFYYQRELDYNSIRELSNKSRLTKAEKVELNALEDRVSLTPREFAEMQLDKTHSSEMDA